MYQVWWKSTQKFLRFRVNEVKNSIFRPSSLTFDLWRWADLAQNLISSSTPGVPNLWPLTLGGSRPKSNQFFYSGCTNFDENPPRGSWDFAFNDGGKNSIFRPSSLTFDLWPWADLAQDLISSSTPGGAPLYQVWWKSTQGSWDFALTREK